MDLSLSDLTRDLEALRAETLARIAVSAGTAALEALEREVLGKKGGLAAFRALETLKTPESFGGWLFGIAYNRCHKWFRRERNKVIKIQEVRQKALEDERRRWKDTQSGPSPRAPEEHLSEVLLRLPEEVRQALTLKYLEGMSYQDIGKRLGINSHRIDYLIRKGKQMIRDRMGRGEAQA